MTARRRARGLLALRYALPAAIVLTGLVVLVADRTLSGLEAFALCSGVGGSVFLLNALYRYGVRGDAERDDEEAARRFLDEHGHWPDEPPPPGR